jgi:hypothetical protein
LAPFYKGEIKIAPKVSIAPYVGGEVTYGALAGLSGRYYFNKIVYASAGAFGHFDGDYSGIGGTAGVGLCFYRQVIKPSI